MNLKQITRRLKSPSAQYWSEVTAAELVELRKDVKNSWIYNAERPFIILCLILSALFGYFFYTDSRSRGDGVYDSVGFTLLMAVFAAAFFLVVLVSVWVLIESIFGQKYLCQKLLSPLESDYEKCAEALKFCETPEANAYRVKVLKSGRELILVDANIMEQLSKEAIKSRIQSTYKEIYAKLNQL